MTNDDQFDRIRDNLVHNIPVMHKMPSVWAFNPLNTAMSVGNDIVAFLRVKPKRKDNPDYNDFRRGMGYQLATAIALAGYETFFKDTNILVRRELVAWLCECSHHKELAQYFKDYEQAWSDFLEANQFEDRDSINFSVPDMEAEIPGSSFLWMAWPKPICPIQEVRQ